MIENDGKTDISLTHQPSPCVGRVKSTDLPSTPSSRHVCNVEANEFGNSPRRLFSISNSKAKIAGKQSARSSNPELSLAHSS